MHLMDLNDAKFASKASFKRVSSLVKDVYKISYIFTIQSIFDAK